MLNTDIEIACDEEVVKKYPENSRKIYALSLIRLAENHRGTASPVNTGFAQHSEIEERIQFIMNTNKYSKKAAAILITGMLCFTVTTFTASAQKSENMQPDDLTAADILPSNADIQTPETAEKIWTDPEETVMADEPSVSTEQIAELAENYLGAPYKSGGTDLSDGVDSPGFIKAVYAQAGIELPADLHKLAANGTEIPLSELSAGDIVFYSSADGNNKFFHAAIYNGNGQVIHASNMKDGVKMSDLNYREISTAVRILYPKTI